MKNWQIIKESIKMCAGLKAPEKMLNIINTFNKETEKMTEQEKINYLLERGM